MRRSLAAVLALLGLLAAACAATPTPTALPAPSAAPVASTATALPVATATPLPAATASLAVLAPTAVPQSGDSLLYLDAGNLYLYDVAGGKSRTLAHGAFREPAWSPDGSKLAVTLWDGSRLTLNLVDVQSGALRSLGPGGLASWSADGRQIAFLVDNQVYIMNADGSGRRTVTTQPGWFWGNPVFNAAGDGLLAAGALQATMGASGNTDFFIYNVSLAGSSRPAPLPGMAAANGRLPYNLMLAPDRESLYFYTSYHVSACQSPGDLVAVSLATGAARSLAPGELWGQIGKSGELSLNGFGYAVSAAGDRIALSAGIADCSGWPTGATPRYLPSKLYIVDTAGRLQSSWGTDVAEPAFSPDGARLAYLAPMTATGQSPDATIYIAKADGTEAQVVGQGHAPLWRPRR